MPTPNNLEKEAELLRELRLVQRRNSLSRYDPYPKQRAFHRDGAFFRERMLTAGTQTGKTFCAAREIAFHATGRYPDWWEGKRFDKPVLIWTGSETNESSKEIIQSQLLGTENPDKNDVDYGTGALPWETIFRTTTRQAGVKNVVDEILVKHVNGGNSRIALKTYEQGRSKWQGKAVDVVWFDEEPDYSIYVEGMARTNTTDGIVLMTFTPLLGYSKVVELFFRPEDGDSPRSLTTMTIREVSHYSPEKIEEIIAAYPEWERESRANGVPMAGEGRVFPINENRIKCDPFEIPRHFARICGIDFGFDHPGAACWVAYDRGADTIYVYDCYKQSKQTPVYHVAAINAKGPWIPVAWPHDGMNAEKSSGKPLKDQYKGVNMLPFTARYDDDKGGSQDLEPVLMEILERMETGRFKVFSHLSEWFDEFRIYHRKDGKVVPRNDDIMASMRYAVMMKRYARPEFIKAVQSHYDRPFLGRVA